MSVVAVNSSSATIGSERVGAFLASGSASSQSVATSLNVPDDFHPPSTTPEPIQQVPFSQPVVSTQPDISQPVVSTHPDIFQPVVSTQTDISQPVVSTQTDISQPVVSTQPDISQPVVSTQPDILQPAHSTQHADVQSVTVSATTISASKPSNSDNTQDNAGANKPDVDVKSLTLQLLSSPESLDFALDHQSNKVQQLKIKVQKLLGNGSDNPEVQKLLDVLSGEGNSAESQKVNTPKQAKLEQGLSQAPPRKQHPNKSQPKPNNANIQLPPMFKYPEPIDVVPVCVVDGVSMYKDTQNISPSTSSNTSSDNEHNPARLSYARQIHHTTPSLHPSKVQDRSTIPIVPKPLVSLASPFVNPNLPLQSVNNIHQPIPSMNNIKNLNNLQNLHKTLQGFQNSLQNMPPMFPNHQNNLPNNTPNFNIPNNLPNNLQNIPNNIPSNIQNIPNNLPSNPQNIPRNLQNLQTNLLSNLQNLQNFPPPNIEQRAPFPSTGKFEQSPLQAALSTMKQSFKKPKLEIVVGDLKNFDPNLLNSTLWNNEPSRQHLEEQESGMIRKRRHSQSCNTRPSFEGKFIAPGKRVLYNQWKNPSLNGSPFLHWKINPVEYAGSKARRCRTKIEPEMLDLLESKYRTSHFVTPYERKQLSETLGITERAVIYWFQNRRRKDIKNLNNMGNNLRDFQHDNMSSGMQSDGEIQDNMNIIQNNSNLGNNTLHIDMDNDLDMDVGERNTEF